MIASGSMRFVWYQQYVERFGVDRDRVCEARVIAVARARVGPSARVLLLPVCVLYRSALSALGIGSSSLTSTWAIPKRSLSAEVWSLVGVLFPALVPRK